MEEIRNIVNLLALFGVPSLCACAVYFAKACIKFGKKQDILANAIQKMMRRDLTQDYHKYMNQGYIEDDDLDMWEASYQAYHALGINGVMDSRREDLIHLNSTSNKAV
jgi:hypothetical protein